MQGAAYPFVVDLIQYTHQPVSTHRLFGCKQVGGVLVTLAQVE